MSETDKATKAKLNYLLIIQLMCTHLLTGLIGYWLSLNQTPVALVLVICLVCGLVFNINLIYGWQVIDAALGKLRFGVLDQTLRLLPPLNLTAKKIDYLAMRLKKLVESEAERTKQFSKIENNIIASVTERERLKLAYDLHDSLEQYLHRICVSTILARLRVKDAPDKANEILDHVIKLEETAKKELSDLLNQLKPIPLSGSELINKLRTELDDLECRYSLDVDAEFEELSDENLPEGATNTLHRIGKEAIQNIRRHAKATKVVLRLYKAKNKLILAIKDNGCGFNPTQKVNTTGLDSMKNQAKSLQGDVKINSQPDKGTEVIVQLPVKKTNDYLEYQLAKARATSYANYYLLGGASLALITVALGAIVRVGLGVSWVSTLAGLVVSVGFIGAVFSWRKLKHNELQALPNYLLNYAVARGRLAIYLLFALVLPLPSLSLPPFWSSSQPFLLATVIMAVGLGLLALVEAKNLVSFKQKYWASLPRQFLDEELNAVAFDQKYKWLYLVFRLVIIGFYTIMLVGLSLDTVMAWSIIFLLTLIIGNWVINITASQRLK